MNKLTRKIFTFVCILTLLVLAACSNSSESGSTAEQDDSNKSSKGTKTMFVGINTPPSVLNPINARELNTQMLSSILFETLFDLDDSMNFLPKLAESMESEDNQNFVIKLNPKAKWTDGEPFTAEDIEFTLQQMANPKVTSTGLKALSVIEGLDDIGMLPEGQTDITGIEIVDAHTLNVKTKAPIDPTFLKEKLGVEIRYLPKHVLKDVNPEQLHQHPFMQKPNVTNGAFTLVNFSKDQYVEFAANPDYYRGAPKLDKLFFKILPSANLVAQLQTGEIHMNVPPVGPIAVEDYEKVENMANVKVISGKPLYPQLMYFNMKTIANEKVRQAIVYAMDRNIHADKLYKGEAEVSEGPYPSIHPYYNESAKKYAYDPEKAKQLLKEAGWDFSKVIDFAIPTGNKTREQSATIIADNLQAVGLKVQINKYDFPTLLQKGAKQEFDLLMLGSPFFLEPDRSQFYQTGAQYNFAGYSSPEVDGLLQKGKKEADPEKRRVIYNEMVEVLQKDLPIATLYVVQTPGVVSKKVKVGEPKDLGMFYNIHEWDIEE